MRRAVFGRWAVFLLVSLSGCTNSAAPDKDEATVRAAFTSLQAAIKARDGEKIWGLLDADSQAAAERAAKSIQAAYGKADAEKKADLENRLKLSAADLSSLTGPGFVRSERFHSKHWEIPESDLGKITIRGDKAELSYIEWDDKTEEKLNLVRRDGAWRFALPMPKGE